MATEKIDPRAALAKMDAEVAAAEAALLKLQTANEEKRKAMLDEIREADLEDVKAKCKLHGFTASDLRSVLKTKGARKTVARKSVPRKAPAKKRTVKAK